MKYGKDMENSMLIVAWEEWLLVGAVSWWWGGISIRAVTIEGRHLNA